MSESDHANAPTLGEVLRTPKYLPIFLANALSQWGDYIARVTIAAVVFERTKSPLATAGVLAVSLVPTFLGRVLLGPLVDRHPYRRVMVAAHLVRAVCVAVLLALVLASSPLVAIFITLFILQLVGGAASASALMMVADLFEGRGALYAKAVGLAAMSAQVNQVIGLAVGGGLLALLGPKLGLVLDLLTFIVAATVIFFVVDDRPVAAHATRGVSGYLRDLASATRDLARHRVLARLVAVSSLASLATVAPEALAIPIAGTQGAGGLLMAAPVAGAVVGIVLIGRHHIRVQNQLILPLALLLPLPLLIVGLHPPIPVVAGLFFISGILQAFMVPLQATFTLVTEPGLRGRFFSLAGAVSVLCIGISFLLAGWLGQRFDPYVGVAASGAITLVCLGVLALRWPRAELNQEMDAAYASPRQAA